MATISDSTNFNSRRCFGCPVRKQCAAGEFVDLAFESLDSSIKENERLVKVQGAQIVYTGTTEDSFIHDAADAYVEKLRTLYQKRKKIEPKLNAFMSDVVKAQLEDSSHFSLSRRQEVLDLAMTEHAEVVDTVRLQLDTADLDEIGSDVIIYTDSDICKAILD